MRRMWSVLFAFVFIISCGAATSRASLVIEMSSPYTPAGVQPAGTGPWGTATFDDVGVNQVQLTMALNLQAAGEFISKWYFNIDPAFDLSQMLVSFQSGQAANSVTFNQDGINVPGSGDADIRFRFATANNSNRFNGTETSVYLFTNNGPGTLTSDSFDYVFSHARNKPTFLSAFHAQGLLCDRSVHVGGLESHGGVTSTPVPEPSSMVLAGLGLGGLGLMGLARRRRAGRSG